MPTYQHGLIKAGRKQYGSEEKLYHERDKME